MLPYGERRHNEQLHLLARIPKEKYGEAGQKSNMPGISARNPALKVTSGSRGPG